jgi:hypothetical protein
VSAGRGGRFDLLAEQGDEQEEEEAVEVAGGEEGVGVTVENLARKVADGLGISEDEPDVL